MPNVEMAQECPRCQAKNFAGNITCKKCGCSLQRSEGKRVLEPCPDCAHMCSRSAESCPNCGRILNRKVTLPGVLNISSRGPMPYAGIIAGAVVLLIVGYFVYPVFFSAKREAEVQTAVIAGKPESAGISEKNRVAARSALNAIGEVESVTSVGTTYLRYMEVLQNSRIKFDAAIRELKPVDESEYAILQKLEEAFQCQLDAKTAWSQFIENGSQYGFLEANNRIVSSMAAKYDYRVESEFGYYNQSVLQAIWLKASEKFRDAEASIQQDKVQ